jgi:hypothetical protein
MKESETKKLCGVKSGRSQAIFIIGKCAQASYCVLENSIIFSVIHSTGSLTNNLFCSVNFFPAKIFFLLRKISLFQNTRKNFGGKKLTEQKRFFLGRSASGPLPK